MNVKLSFAPVSRTSCDLLAVVLDGRCEPHAHRATSWLAVAASAARSAASRAYAVTSRS